ncbi:YraN family protein [Helicobacter muridarum]|uniref:UPF0102 protein LS73_002075 n=1 Tax=Helicobacter muridarum TaxID=216 RepID=A0A377PTX5_9HELI|nr:YraN family protein [Helicobacter muridarum]TLE01087.1 YraN family protein [Helicobacter muridarum]STQ85949.1 endonuclease like protein [Helicobacter muridarum]
MPINERRTINTRKIGNHYEDLALKYLCERGFVFIDRNFYSQYGEIDLIMQKEETLHFIEIKGTSSIKSPNPLLKITTAKLEKMTKTIHIFLEKRKYYYNFCIDALAIQDNNITFIENITI